MKYFQINESLSNALYCNISIERDSLRSKLRTNNEEMDILKLKLNNLERENLSLKDSYVEENARNSKNTSASSTAEHFQVFYVIILEFLK